MATPHPEPSGVLLLTGVMASGKSTVAELIAQRSPRSVHLRGDVFRRFIVSGRCEITPTPSAEALAQLHLRYRLATRAADEYASDGFFVVLQDVILGPALADVVAMVRTRPRFVVVLDPDAAVVSAREDARMKTAYSQWDPALMVESLRASTPHLGLWLDTSSLSPAESVAELMDRLDEAVVADPAD